MLLRPILRLLLAGLVATAALAPAPLTLAPGAWPLHPPSAHADGGDWPMFRHDLAHAGLMPVVQ